MDTMFQFGRKVVLTKEELDAKLGAHEEAYYDEERFLTVSGQRYALRGRSKQEKPAWEYSELHEVSRDQVTAYHVTTDYRDEFDKEDGEPKKWEPSSEPEKDKE
ncbi:hypothetical protein [Gorillibacterium sp. sgz5001074]|uniref:hypothetical protein n=1 Tax=Gorillibacterium sp. sgz5001074 TaxID=3446695 RepID=UPI003F675CD6